MKLNIPKSAASVIAVLEGNGYEAYAVGGCVRDALRLAEPHDWDITTSAHPEVTLNIFSELYGFSAIPTGIAHGTVTVVCDKTPIEVTTFRIDGEYTDSRHPDSVTFTDKLSLDLSRRDFTINAMAYSDARGLVDPFGGVRDLQSKTIRCVGDPLARFSEDALRILRALRFASVLGFKLEKQTENAVLELYPRLSDISRERICTELSKLLLGEEAEHVVREFLPIISSILPDACFEDADKICCAIGALKTPSLPLALAALFSDSSYDAMESSLRALRFDNKTTTRCKAIHCHLHDPISDKIALKRLVRDIGADSAYDVFRLGIARGEREPSALGILEQICAQGDCLSLASLEVDGHDIAALGAKSRQIGKVLDDLLDAVICGDVSNDRELLLAFARQLINRKDQHQ